MPATINPDARQGINNRWRVNLALKSVIGASSRLRPRKPMGRKSLSLKCREHNCSYEPYLGGLCRVHHDEHTREKQLRDAAITALHRGEVNGEFLVDGALRDDLEQLRARWFVVCDVVNSSRGKDLVPLEHAGYATDWCISLAEQIVEAQRAISAGEPVASSFESTKSWVWKRLRDIEIKST
jgi:hypothetical protein